MIYGELGASLSALSSADIFIYVVCASLKSQTKTRSWMTPLTRIYRSSKRLAKISWSRKSWGLIMIVDGLDMLWNEKLTIKSWMTLQSSCLRRSILEERAWPKYDMRATKLLIVIVWINGGCFFCSCFNLQGSGDVRIILTGVLCLLAMKLVVGNWKPFYPFTCLARNKLCSHFFFNCFFGQQKLKCFKNWWTSSITSMMNLNWFCVKLQISYG